MSSFDVECDFKSVRVSALGDRNASPLMLRSDHSNREKNGRTSVAVLKGGNFRRGGVQGLAYLSIQLSADNWASTDALAVDESR
jgi:hypothetical protein